MQFFGQFLVKEGAITVDQLRTALDLMARENLRLGQIAVEQRLLSESEANEINREQRYSDKPFGSIAVKLGLMSEVQLKEVLKVQNQRRVRIGEALVRLKHLSAEELVRQLRRFKAEEERFAIDSRELPGYLKDNRIAEFLLELVARVAMRTSSVQIKVPKHCTKLERLNSKIIASVLIRSEHSLRIALSGDSEFAHALTDGVFGQAPDEVLPDEMLDDAVGEFLNMLAGNALAGLEQEGIPCELDPPIRGIPPLGGYAFDLVTTAGSATLILSEP